MDVLRSGEHHRQDGAHNTAVSPQRLHAQVSLLLSKLVVNGDSIGSKVPTTQLSPSSKLPAQPPSPRRVVAPEQTTRLHLRPLPEVVVPWRLRLPPSLKHLQLLL